MRGQPFGVFVDEHRAYIARRYQQSATTDLPPNFEQKSYRLLDRLPVKIPDELSATVLREKGGRMSVIIDTVDRDAETAETAHEADADLAIAH